MTTTNSMSLLLLLLLFSSTATATAAAAVATNHVITSFSSSNSSWSPSQNLTLLSPSNTFAAGFHQLPSSPSRFTFSVWVQAAADKTIVWSLKTTNPISSSSQLSITPSGTLVLLDSARRNETIFSSNSNDTQLVLQDDGQLIFGNWSSFGSPTDTILANQKISSTGVSLSSNNYQLVNATSLLFNNTNSYWTNNDDNNNPTPIRNLTVDGYIRSDSSSLITSDIGDVKVLRRLTLDPDGNLKVYSLRPSGKWRVVWQGVLELSLIYGKCGYNEICMPNEIGNSTYCVCPPGYRK